MKNLTNKIAPISNHDEMERCTQQYTELYFYKDKLQNNMETELIAIKKKFQAKIEPINKLLEEIEKSVFTYLQENKKSILKDKQSIILPYAKIGFRRSSEINLPDNHDSIIQSLKDLGKNNCIKQSESIRKSVLNTLTENELNKLGIEKIEKETPFIVPSLSL